MKCKLTSSRCKCNDTNYYYHFFGLFNSQLKCKCPNFQLIKNLTKPIFRAQNTRICLQKCQPYREAKFASMTHDLQRMKNKLTRWRQIEGLSSWTTPQPSAESSFTSLYLCYSHIHCLIQLNCTRHKAITAITRIGKLTLLTDVTWRHQPVFDPLLVPSFWDISEAEQGVFGQRKFKKCFGRGLSKDQNQF